MAANNQQSIFAPPSKEELDQSSLFSPPTQQELSGTGEKQGFWSDVGKSAINELPAMGGIVGGVIGDVPGAFAGGFLGKAAQNLLNRYVSPQNAPQTTSQAILSPVVSGAEQGAAQGIGNLIAPAISRIPGALKSFAAKKAITATGATGKQAMEFAPDAGEQLLKRNIVGFANNPQEVAQKATAAVENSEQSLDDALSKLSSSGAVVNKYDIIKKLRDRAEDLSDDPAQFAVSDQLNRLADRIGDSIDKSGITSTSPISEKEAVKRGVFVPIAKAENTKRGFWATAKFGQNISNYERSASKEAGDVYRQAVEDAATKFNPEIASQFKEAKKTYGLLSPIADAASARSATLNQSPHGGLLDVASAGAGAVLGGKEGAIAAPVARRFISPRIPSAEAVGANALGTGLQNSMGIIAPGIQSAPHFLMPDYSTIPGKNNGQ